MKTELKIIAFLTVILTCIGLIVSIKQNEKTELDTNSSEVLLSNNILLKSTTKEQVENNSSETLNQEELENTIQDDENIEKIEEPKTEVVKESDIVFDGLTKEELVAKLNRNLNSTLAGTGEIFANYALELGIDPYLAVAIVLHETGCSWNCSDLVNQCNNVGGLKGSPGCGGGSYAIFATLEEGISSFMNNLYKNYYAYGLTTPEAINSKYAASTTWASKINYYIDKIKAS